MHILLIEPYYGGSHRVWVDGYVQHTSHEISLLTMPAQFWKWRMQGGAVTLARLYREHQYSPDMILISDMCDVSTFSALTADLTGNIPVALYFHESQLTYPQNSRQFHGWRYGFTNYVSALAADHVYFNSSYHMTAFFENLPHMLKHFGDFNELGSIETIREKSSLLSLGLDLKCYDRFETDQKKPDLPPLILWNHRWEEEKNPTTFFNALYRLMDENIPFRVAITGENVRQQPEEFEQARARLGERLVQYGFIDDFEDYARLLWQSDFVISASYQEFFGGAMAEAIYCECIPIMPDRLNYPNLIPQEVHQSCLYPTDKSLYYLLKAHLTKDISIKTPPLRDYIAKFDWSVIAPLYDATFEDLVK